MPVAPATAFIPQSIANPYSNYAAYALNATAYGHRYPPRLCVLSWWGQEEDRRHTGEPVGLSIKFCWSLSERLSTAPAASRHGPGGMCVCCAHAPCLQHEFLVPFTE